LSKFHAEVRNQIPLRQGFGGRVVVVLVVVLVLE
jgi:hypothetical protein